MALFSSADASFLPALLHVGFSARLETASSAKYVAEGRDGACILADEADAPPWYIVSRDVAPAGEKNFAPRVALATTASAGGQSRFLGMYDGEAPEVGTSPCAVRIVLPKPAGSKAPADPTFAFRQVLQDKRLLSARPLQDPAAKAGAMSLWTGSEGREERFLLRVCAKSIGRGPGFVVPKGNEAAFVSVADAMTFALLELGVRCRIRSVHGRVLWRTVRDATDSKPGTKKKKKRKFMVVRQDGPASGEEIVSEDHVVFEAMKRSSQEHDGAFVCTVVEAGGAGRILTIGAHNLERSKVLLHQSAAVLAEMSAGDVAAGKSGSMLVVRASGRGWGNISIGAPSAPAKEKGTSGGSSDAVEWLMAGPRGRLEVRKHCSTWESFSLELVEQSYTASLSELPPSHLFAEADSADRAMARIQIAQKVAAARSEGESTASKVGNKESFNHAAALSAIGSGENGNAGVKSPGGGAPSGQATQKGSGKPARAVKSPNQATTTAAAATAATTNAAPVTLANNQMPRTAMNKKAKQRAKKEKKKKAKAALAASASRDPSPSPAAAAVVKKSDSDSGDKAEASSSTPAAAPKESSSGGKSGTGPPCAACGRACTGTYTKVLGKDYHPTCFGCRTCRRVLLPGAGQFREHRGAPYCTTCYASGIAPKCARCTKPIMETVTTAMEKTWHKACLTCIACRLPLSETFWLYANKPNEPRCNQCVTGSDAPAHGVNYNGHVQRNVNLPGPLFNRGNATGPSTSALSGPSPSTGGRARLTTPIVPNIKR